MNGQNIKLASDVTGFTIDAVKKTDYEGASAETIYLDELEGITSTQVEVLSKIDIHTGDDFLSVERDVLLALKGFGEKTIQKIVKSIDVASSEIESDEVVNKPDLEEVEE